MFDKLSAEILFPSSLKPICLVVFQGSEKNKAESADLTPLLGREDPRPEEQLNTSVGLGVRLVLKPGKGKGMVKNTTEMSFDRGL